MTKIVSIMNQKGGTGKSTTTFNLGVGLARQGKRVLLIDSDPQGDLTTYAGIQNQDELPVTLSTVLSAIVQDVPIPDAIIKCEEDVDIIPSNIDLSALEMQLIAVPINREKVLEQYLDTVKQDYDYILIDCMPSLNMIPINALACSDSVIIPCQAQFLSVKGMTELIKTIQMVKRGCNPKLKIEGILITLFDRRTKFAKTIEDVLRNNYGDSINIFDTVIPVGTKTAESSAEGKSLFLYDPKGNVTKAYSNLTKEILCQI